MGVRIITSYQTPEGFQVTEVYSRIGGFSFDFGSNTTTVRQIFYLTRDMRLDGRSLGRVPFTTDIFTFQAPFFPTIDMLYYHLKRQLTSKGFVVEDVLESGQTPSTYSEPDPAETSAVDTAPQTISV